jgi:hypothetical protein
MLNKFKQFSQSVLISTLIIGNVAFAQGNFPEKALHIIVPQPPGGGFDFVGRVLGDKLAPVMKENIIVENKTRCGYCGRYRLCGKTSTRWVYSSCGFHLEYRHEPMAL